MKTIQFNINNVTVTKLDGTTVQLPLGALLGDYIYGAVAKLDWLAIAQAVHKGEPAALTPQQAQELIALIEHERCPFTLMVKVAVINHITNLLKQNENGTESN